MKTIQACSSRFGMYTAWNTFFTCIFSSEVITVQTENVTYLVTVTMVVGHSLLRPRSHDDIILIAEEGRRACNFTCAFLSNSFSVTHSPYSTDNLCLQLSYFTATFTHAFTHTLSCNLTGCATYTSDSLFTVARIESYTLFSSLHNKITCSCCDTWGV